MDERIRELENLLYKIHAEAKRSYCDDVEQFAKQSMNDNWNEHTKHTQTFGWMCGEIEKVLKK